jgi:hypothetical protein
LRAGFAGFLTLFNQLSRWKLLERVYTFYMIALTYLGASVFSD